MKTNRAFLLRSRPRTLGEHLDLELVERPVADLHAGQALVRGVVLSVDPTSLVWMSDIDGYLPAVELGEVMRGLGVGRVVASSRADLPEGAWVLGFFGWQEYYLVDVDDPAPTVLPDPLPAPPSTFLGALGHTGICGWLATEIVAPRPGETVVVSAAAGAVGSVAGQLLRERGARVVGIVGGEEKRRYVLDELGFDACIDRHHPMWRDALDEATPDRVHGNVENSGGVILDHVLGRLAVGARIALCGMIADYSGDPEARHGLRNLVQVIQQRASVTGFLVLDHASRFDEISAELAARIADGRLRVRETVIDGLENAPAALGRIVSGNGRGKVLVRIGPDDVQTRCTDRTGRSSE